MKGYRPSSKKTHIENLAMRQEMLRGKMVRRAFGVGQTDPGTISPRSARKRTIIKLRRKNAYGI